MFKNLKLNEVLYDIITEKLNYKEPTIVQNEVIKRFNKNQDVIVKACTGSGKTISYVLPMFNILLNVLKDYEELRKDDNLSYFKSNEDLELKETKTDQFLNLGILAVILVPTRELAVQVYDVINIFLEKIKSLKATLLIGGRRIDIDLLKFKNDFYPNIIVSTPGRLCDIDKQLTLSFNKLELLIIDEADKMLEIGLTPELSYLIDKFNKQRRTGLFSATMNSQMDNIIMSGLRNPVYIDVQFNTNNKDGLFMSNSDSKLSTIKIIDDYFNRISEIKALQQEIPKQLDNYYVLMKSLSEKLPILLQILNHYLSLNKKIMIFFATCSLVDYYSLVLSNEFKELKEKINENEELIYKIHSKVSQKKRNTEYKKFLKCKAGVLLTTDLSSRGIDIPNLDIVIQFDPPKNEEIFVHRVGRTARVGKKGESYLFLMNNHEMSFLSYLKNKGIILKEVNKNTNNDKNDLLIDLNSNIIQKQDEKLLNFNISDKWIYDKAVKAFVSYVKFYTEHDLKYIFDSKLFDFGDFANSLQLCRLPRVKEILGRKISTFKNHLTIDPKNLVYLNKNIESQMKEKSVKSEEKRNEKKLRQEIIQIDKERRKNKSRHEKKKSKQMNSQKEWDDFADEERLFKKLKKGKISKEEYDKIFLKAFN